MRFDIHDTKSLRKALRLCDDGDRLVFYGQPWLDPGKDTEQREIIGALRILPNSEFEKVIRES